MNAPAQALTAVAGVIDINAPRLILVAALAVLSILAFVGVHLRAVIRAARRRAASQRPFDEHAQFASTLLDGPLIPPPYAGRSSQ